MNWDKLLVKYLLYGIETFPFTATSILSINNFITSTLIAWSGIDLLPTRISTPLTNLSNQIGWVLHLVGTVFLLWSYPNESLSNIPLVDAFHTVEKYYWELLKV